MSDANQTFPPFSPLSGPDPPLFPLPSLEIFPFAKSLIPAQSFSLLKGNIQVQLLEPAPKFRVLPSSITSRTPLLLPCT